MHVKCLEQCESPSDGGGGVGGGLKLAMMGVSHTMEIGQYFTSELLSTRAIVNHLLVAIIVVIFLQSKNASIPLPSL